MLLGFIQHKRILNNLYKTFDSFAPNVKNKEWLDKLDKLTDSDKEELLVHFYNCQSLTIVKRMNTITPCIHVPMLGNFKIVAQRYYNTIHKDFFDTLDKKETTNFTNCFRN